MFVQRLAEKVIVLRAVIKWQLIAEFLMKYKTFSSCQSTQNYYQFKYVEYKVIFNL